jgi:hypothetical protein
MGITRGGNHSGVKWNKGGKKARGGMLSIDFSAFADYAEKLDLLGANLQEVFGDAMDQAAETVQDDVKEATASANLPAKGKYSQGETMDSIIPNPRTIWHGSFGEIGLGFDKTQPGAGGFLITGTPRMRPDFELEDIFARKKYARKIREQIADQLQDEIETIMGG